MDYLTIKTDSFKMTNEEFFHFCQENDGLRIEKSKNGEILIMSPTGFNSGKINLIISSQLWLWNEESGLGVAVDSSTGFLFPDGSMRSPDAAWVSKEKIKGINLNELDSFPPICPEFVVELVSSSDRPLLIQSKMVEYISNGVQLAWYIDPIRLEVGIYRSSREVEWVKGFTGVLSGESVLPGFQISLAKLLV